MARNRYSSPKYDQFFFRGDNLSESRKNWNKEMTRLLNRAGDWVRKFHAVADIPTKPDRATKSAIQRIKEMVWKNIDEPTRKQYHKEYEYRYEQEDEEIYHTKPPYIPPTEKDFYENPDHGEDYDREWEEQHPELEEPDEDGYRETVVSRDEIEAWIDANINTITVDKELEGVREQLNNLVFEAADAYGDYEGYLSYLESNAATLVDLATKAIYGYVGKNGKIYQDDPQALSKFATVLNLNRPLDISQSERLQDEGWVSYDFNDL